MSSWWAYKDHFFAIEFSRSKGSEDGPPKASAPWSYELDVKIYKRLFHISFHKWEKMRRLRKSSFSQISRGGSNPYLDLYFPLGYLSLWMEDEWFHQDTNCHR